METPGRTSGFRPYDLLSLLGLLVIVGAFGWQRFTTRALPGQPRWYYIAGATLILLHVTLRWDAIADAIGRRQLRYGTNSAVLGVALLAVLAGLNYLAVKRDKSWDLSKGRRHSLSDQTRKVLDGLKSDVSLTYFDRGNRLQEGREQLEQFRRASARVKTDYVDVLANPIPTRENEITGPTVLVVMGDRREKVANVSEQDVTNAIIKVTRGARKTICFVEGEGERDLDDGAPRGYSGAKAALTKTQYGTRKVFLAREGAVPAECTVTVVPGPEKDMFPPAVDALRRYVRGGGKALLMLEPDLRGSTPALAALAGEWNITVGNDVVVDSSGMGQMVGGSALTPMVMSYPLHEITKDLRVMTAFHTVRSVKAATGGAPGIAAQDIAETLEVAWAETDLSLKGGQVRYEEGQDRRGPVSLAAVATLTGAALGPSTPASPAPAASPATTLEGPVIASPGAPPPPLASPSASPSPEASPSPDDGKREARVAVYGDTDWASNQLLGVEGNQDLFLNTVAWLAQDSDLISIRAREPDDQRLVLSQQQQGNVRLFSLLLLPGALLAAGVYSWWRRRG